MHVVKALGDKAIVSVYTLRAIKGCLWLTRGLVILEMKAANELAISLPV